MSNRRAFAPDELNQAGGAYPPLSVPLIQNSIFVPLMKKALMGDIGADAKTSLLIDYIDIKSSPPPHSWLLCPLGW